MIMSNILIDISYLEALINVNHEKHDQADKIAGYLKDYDRFYIPNHILILLMEKNKEHSVECQKIFNILINSTRIDCSMGKIKYLDSFKKYGELNGLSYNDWLTVTYMKYKKLHYILSFNEHFDEIPGIKRIYRKIMYNN